MSNIQEQTSTTQASSENAKSIVNDKENTQNATTTTPIVSTASSEEERTKFRDRFLQQCADSRLQKLMELSLTKLDPVRDQGILIDGCFSAMQTGQFQTVEKILAHFPTLNVNFLATWPQPRENGSFGQLTLLCGACQVGWIGIVKLLCTKFGADVNLGELEDRPIFYALRYAMANNDTKIIEYLLQETKIDIEARSKAGYTPIMYVAKSGNVNVLKLLVQARASLSSVSADGSNSLHQAILSSNKACVEFLLKKGANVNEICKQYDSSPLVLAISVKSDSIAETLINAGADVNFISESEGVCPLSVAIAQGNYEMAKMLLSRGANPNLQQKLKTPKQGSEMSNPVLLAAIEHPQLSKKLVDLLLQYKVDPSLTGIFGWSAFHVAIKQKSFKMAKLFIQACPTLDVKKVDTEGRNAIHLAQQNGNLEGTKYLVGQKVDHNLKAKNGSTAFHLACQGGFLECAKYLYSLGHVDINAKTDKLVTPIYLATLGGHFNIVSWLSGFEDIELNPKLESGFTPLFAASRDGHTKIVALLLSKHVNPNFSLEEKKEETKATSTSAPNESELSNKTEESTNERVITTPTPKDSELSDKEETSSTTTTTTTPQVEVTEQKEESKEITTTTATTTTQTPKKWYPLNIATKSGHSEIVELLLKHKAIAHETDVDGFTPLLVAGHNGFLDIVKSLVEIGKIDVMDSSKNRYNLSPVVISAMGGHLPTFEYMLSKVPEEQKSETMNFAFAMTAQEGKFKPLLHLFLKYQKKININWQGRNLATPLLLAAERGQYLVVKFFHGMETSNNVNWESRDAFGRNALDIALITLKTIQNGSETKITEPDMKIIIDILRERKLTETPSEQFKYPQVPSPEAKPMDLQQLETATTASTSTSTPPSPDHTEKQQQAASVAPIPENHLVHNDEKQFLRKSSEKIQISQTTIQNLEQSKFGGNEIQTNESTTDLTQQD